MALEFIPTFHFVENSTKDDASRRDTQKENAARPATVEVTYVSTGTGQQRITTPVPFPITFRTEPHFTSGSAVISNPASATWHDPIGHCGIYAWRTDSRGFFTGAYLWVRVEAYPVDEDSTASAPMMRTQHYLTFSAQGFKDIPTKGVLATLPTRMPGVI